MAQALALFGDDYVLKRRAVPIIERVVGAALLVDEDAFVRERDALGDASGAGVAVEFASGVIVPAGAVLMEKKGVLAISPPQMLSG